MFFMEHCNTSNPASCTGPIVHLTRGFMLSLYILYSNDRIQETKATIECLSDCSGFDSCQKILCSDGHTNFHPEGFEILEISRPQSGLYCWANMWDAALKICTFEKVLYMDSDRILPTKGLKEISQSITDNTFVFPKNLFSFKEKCDIDTIKDTRDDISNNMHLLKPDHRIYSSAWDAVRKKNPMSGCTGFTKNTFFKSGGLDQAFQGWGYPDTDYFEKTSRMNMKFIPLDMNELHLHHKYEIPTRELKLMNLWNGCQFCRKWGYEIHPNLNKIAEETNVPIRLAKRYNMKEFLEIATTGIKI